MWRGLRYRADFGKLAGGCAMRILRRHGSSGRNCVSPAASCQRKAFGLPRRIGKAASQRRKTGKAIRTGSATALIL